MSKTLCTFAAVVLALALSTTPASAKILTFTALINGGQETPVMAVAGEGIAFFSYDKDTDTLTYSNTCSGLASGETAAHIHGPADPGVAGIIVVGLPAGNPKNGTIGTFSALSGGDALKQLKKGLLYVNIHTVGNPAGEIRGQILPSSK